ncbi:hypothetical protein SARC_06882 [Sphaeroforma arctica JP610]|uniref:Uncharacterized protein n=1 Tax=Sphaeroforma arctica JP610 TaxID=667725 RepID=A0A0L0FXT2_9EUKA|nr:hypothetical protein SARC_06882 [Sphaeroforma arctica JP610]KNC80773.1 hypothetical protein SARC_06882 [Sphaeroforma arctica JP610]|eukprot:XP_014154675.1 hypothetical protein SARC_06882 [Sphaeroforma arctica JP610]
MEDAGLNDDNVDTEKELAEKQWKALQLAGKQGGMQEGVFVGRNDEDSLQKYFDDGFYECVPISERLGRLQGLTGSLLACKKSTPHGMKALAAMDDRLMGELNTIYAEVGVTLYVPTELSQDHALAIKKVEALEARVRTLLKTLQLPNLL